MILETLFNDLQRKKTLWMVLYARKLETEIMKCAFEAQ